MNPQEPTQPQAQPNPTASTTPAVPDIPPANPVPIDPQTQNMLNQQIAHHPLFESHPTTPASNQGAPAQPLSQQLAPEAQPQEPAESGGQGSSILAIIVGVVVAVILLAVGALILL